MRTLFIGILAAVTSWEVFQAISAGIKWNSYSGKVFTVASSPCPPREIVVQYVEHNPLNNMNIDSFMEVYGFTKDNIAQAPKKKHVKSIKQDTIIEPKKIAPKMARIKVTKIK